jgi:hypothetical protein
MTQDLEDLLTDLHGAFDRLVDELRPDRPDLADALRAETDRWPRPPSKKPRRAARCSQVPALLYRALDAGVVGSRTFDRLMLRQRRAAGALRRRATTGG